MFCWWSLIPTILWNTIAKPTRPFRLLRCPQKCFHLSLRVCCRPCVFRSGPRGSWYTPRRPSRLGRGAPHGQAEPKPASEQKGASQAPPAASQLGHERADDVAVRSRARSFSGREPRRVADHVAHAPRQQRSGQAQTAGGAQPVGAVHAPAVTVLAW